MDPLLLQSLMNSLPMSSYILPNVNLLETTTDTTMISSELTYSPLVNLMPDHSYQMGIDFSSSPIEYLPLFPSPFPPQPLPSHPIMPIASQNEPTIMFRAEFRERSDNWSTEETSAMLAILKNHSEEFRNSLRKNQTIWASLVQELKSLGYQRTKSHCKNRWKVLVTKFNRAEKLAKTCDFYEELSGLIKTRRGLNLSVKSSTSPY